MDHFEAQNILDFFAIVLLMCYSMLRIIYPYGSGLDVSRHDEITQVLEGDGMRTFNAMPTMHFIAMCFMFLQVFYFFMVLNYLSKYVQLIFKGLRDAFGFLQIF